MDIENVIKGLEELEGFLFKEYTEIKAEESKIYYDRFKSLSDAIDLLKEQGPQSVIVHEKPRNGNILWFADCPKCNHGIERDKHKRFCGFCGQAVKWE